MATAAAFAANESFWQRMAIGLSLFIVFAFAQFALRGIADPINAPFWVHLHGVAMLAWLALLVVQPTLVTRNSRELHRRWGWVGAVLAVLIVGLGIFVGVASVAMQRHAPFFPPPYFLALTVVEALAFGLLVAWAIHSRRKTDWHRRYMIGATIVLLEPALGRVLPMPLIIGWSDLPVGIIQLLVVGIIAWHDRRTIGHIHPATIRIALVVIAMRAIIPILGATTLFASFAQSLIGK